jgi:peptidoglycan/LPS O-acetylase OafA/YrhL
VDLFFVLSGFLITGILLEQRKQQFRSYLTSFYARRVRRILPPYLLFLGITSLLFGVGWLQHWYLFLFLMNTETFLELSSRYSVGVLWSLAVEEQFYTVWPFAVYLLTESALAWLAGGLVLTAPLLRWIATDFVPGHWPIHFSTPFRMDLLAVGALIAVVWRHRHATVERFGVYGLVLAATAVTPPLLLSRHPYTLYLVHLTVLTIARHYVHRYSAAIALAVSLLYSGLSWHFLEKPILQSGKGMRFLGGNSKSAATMEKPVGDTPAAL